MAEQPWRNVEEFEEAYAAQRNITVEQLHADGWFGYKVLYCSMEGCDGWHMGTPESYEMERQLSELMKRQ